MKRTSGSQTWSDRARGRGCVDRGVLSSRRCQCLPTGGDSPYAAGLPIGDALLCLPLGDNRSIVGRLAVAEYVAQRREVAECDLDDVAGNEIPSADESDTCG